MTKRTDYDLAPWLLEQYDIWLRMQRKRVADGEIANATYEARQSHAGGFVRYLISDDGE